MNKKNFESKFSIFYSKLNESQKNYLNTIHNGIQQNPVENFELEYYNYYLGLNESQRNHLNAIHEKTKVSLNKNIPEKKPIFKKKSLTLILIAVIIGIFIGNTFLQNDFSITGLVTGNLPDVGDSNWGTILNNYLLQEHTTNGTHGNVTAESLNVSGLIRADNWTNVSITENQISDFKSYRTLDNLTFVGDLNTTGDGNFTGNLTIGEKITFAFGEIIDNLVEGFVRITGNLNVTGNLTILGNISQSGTPDANTLYAKSLPKAWVNFNGNTTGCASAGDLCTIKDSFNVDNVTRNGQGDYTIYWDRDFANGDYSIMAMASASPLSPTEQISVELTKDVILLRVSLRELK